MLKQIVLAAALVLPGLALACDGDSHAGSKQLSIKEAAQLKKEGQVTLVDANGDNTRQKWGVVPGAVLLTSSSKFDAAKELPSNKDSQLVFYCANTQCSAAPGAAKRAAEAGYTHVAVMPEGIMGWVKSGQPVDKTAGTKS